MLFYNILVEQHFFLEMRMLKNMKKKLTVILASLALCFVSVGCTMNWDPFWTVYTDTWTYDMYKDCFDDTITSGAYKKKEFSEAEWKEYKYIFEEGTRHFYEKEEISDWLLVHDLSEENSKKEAAWLTLVDHGCIVIRNFNEVYFISK